MRYSRRKSNYDSIIRRLWLICMVYFRIERIESSIGLCACEPGTYFRIDGVPEHIYECKSERVSTWDVCMKAGSTCFDSKRILPAACANDGKDKHRMLPRTFAIVDDPNNVFRYFDGSFWDYFSDWEVTPRKELKRVINEASPGSFFLDVGSWIGPYSLEALASSSHVRVRAIEPDPRANAAWKANVAANPGFADRAEVFRRCIDPVRETAVMSAARLGDSKTKLSSSGTHTFEVPCVALDRWLLSHADVKVALIKIDIEGHELRSIVHAPRKISDALRMIGEPPMMIEVHPKFYESPTVPELETLAYVLTYEDRGHCSFFTREGPIRLDRTGLMRALSGRVAGVFQLICYPGP